MNRLKPDKQKQVIASLVEGNSIRATCRMTDTAKGTVLKLLADVGKACAEYQNEVMKDLSCQRIQVDEIWSFCYAKGKNVPDDKKGKFGYGDVYTFTALCADTKIVPSWYIGKRDRISIKIFMNDLARRIKNRVQLTTDNYSAYLEAVESAFGDNIDYSQLVKVFGVMKEGVKYNPERCVQHVLKRLMGILTLTMSLQATLKGKT